MKTTRNERSGDCILQIFENFCKKGMYFLFFIRTEGGVGGKLLNGQNLLSVTEVICRQSLTSTLHLATSLAHTPTSTTDECQHFMWLELMTVFIKNSDKSAIVFQK